MAGGPAVTGRRPPQAELPDDLRLPPGPPAAGDLAAVLRLHQEVIERLCWDSVMGGTAGYADHVRRLYDLASARGLLGMPPAPHLSAAEGGR